MKRNSILTPGASGSIPPTAAEIQAAKIEEHKGLFSEIIFRSAMALSTNPPTEEEIEARLEDFKKRMDTREAARRRDNLLMAEKVSDSYPNLKKHFQDKAMLNVETIYDKGVLLKTQTLEQIRERTQIEKRKLLGLNFPKNLLDMPGEKK